MSQIEQLLLKYKQGSLNNEEASMLKGFAQNDDLDQSAEIIQNLLESTASYKVPEKINASLAWDKFSKNPEFAQELDSKKRSWLPLAVLSFMVVLGFTLWNLYKIQPDHTIFASTGIQQMELADHTKLTLDSNSSISYSESFNTQNRIIKLKGKAHFDVTHSADFPFTLEFDDSKLVVIGTDFTVDSKAPNIKIIELRSGKIAFYANRNSKPSYLSKGQRLVYDKTANKITITDSRNLNSFYWVDQNLVFKSALVKDVLNTLEGIFHVTYTLNSSEVGNCHLSAVFNKSDLLEIHTTLEQILGIKISKIDKDSYGIFSGNCQ